MRQYTRLTAENLTVIFINNGVYGMTGGRWLDYLINKTATTVLGRQAKSTDFL